MIPVKMERQKAWRPRASIAIIIVKNWEIRLDFLQSRVCLLLGERSWPRARWASLMSILKRHLFPG